MNNYTTNQLLGKLKTALNGGFAIFTITELTNELIKRKAL